MNLPAKMNPADITEIVIAKGDVSKLTAEERNVYYASVCRSVGLNPLTRPLEYLTLQGKMVLYARRDAADQLRKLHNISIEIVSKTCEDGLYSVHVRAKDGNGRTDEDLGVVALPDTAKGEIRANLILKAITKAKRRVTLSISGLGFLDETEVEDIPANQRRPVESDVPPAPKMIETTASAGGGGVAMPSGPHAIPQKNFKGMKAWSDAYLGFIRSSQSVKEMQEWDTANAETLDAINAKEPALYESINTVVATKMNDFAPPKARTRPTQRPIAKVSTIPESDGDPEAFLKWVEQTLAAVTDAADLEPTWNDTIAASLDSLFPPDAEEALRIYRHHERRLGIE